MPNEGSPFDFSQPDNTSEDPLDFSTSAVPRRLYRRRNLGLALIALVGQVVSVLLFCFSWPIAVGALLGFQLMAVFFIASDSRGRGAETAVWCLVGLLFPLIGLVVYLVAVNE